MEEAPAMAMRRSTEKSGLPPQGSRRRRASTSSAWPAFPPGEMKSSRSGPGLGSGKQSPVSNAENLPRSPAFSSASSFTSCGSAARKLCSDSPTGGRVSGCGIKSPGLVRTKASCCDSCRPAAGHSSSCKQEKMSGIRYDDVFGGPPKYLASVSSTVSGRKSSAIPDYNDIFQGSNRRSSFSGNAGQAQAKSRDSELPVFDLPGYETGNFPPAAEKLKSPSPARASPAAATGGIESQEIVYDDVFGGPLTGPRTKLLKDLLKCSGFLEAKKKSNRASPRSDSSPASSSIHSICRESSTSIGNPVYEYESEVYEDGKHFNSPRKSSLGSVEKSLPAYGANNRKPVVTSVSASSSPFTENFDDSTVNSRVPSRVPSSDRVADNVFIGTTTNASAQPVRSSSGKAFEPELEVASSSSTPSPESDYLRRPPPKHPYTETRKNRGNKSRRPPRVRANKREPGGGGGGGGVHRDTYFSEASSYDMTLDGDKKFGGEQQQQQLQEADSSVLCDSPPTERDYDFDLELPVGSACLNGKPPGRLGNDGMGKKEPKQVSFVTVSSVHLKTEPSSVPPARAAPAPNKNVDILSEKEMSELLETEAFMEYSIKDLDGLVAEEYLVSHESISESSPSTSSVSNSLKTSLSGRSYEDEDSDHCYAKDSISPEAERDPGPGKSRDEDPGPGKSGKDAGNGEVLRAGGICDESVLKCGTKGSPDSSEANDIKSNLEELISSSSSSFGEQTSKEGTTCSDDMSSLCEFEEIVGEPPERRKLRWERFQRASERVAKAMAEKNERDLELEREEIEKQRVAELLDDVIKRWAAGKRGNLRALLSTLQYILWPECGWQPVSLIDIIEPVAVRKAYRKATLCVHPDKLQQKNAPAEHRFIAAKIFDFLQESWTTFNYEQSL